MTSGGSNNLKSLLKAMVGSINNGYRAVGFFSTNIIHNKGFGARLNKIKGLL